MSKQCSIPIRPEWIRLEIPHKDGWVWGMGVHNEWCEEHCSERYSINKFKVDTLTAHFENPKDATMFAMRWL